MKKLFIILFTIFSLASIQAQSPLQHGDYVTVSMISEWGNTIPRKFLEASTNGVKYTENVNDNCLFQLEVENNCYRFKDVTTGLYLRVNNNGANSGSLILSNSTNASGFYFTDKGSDPGNFMYGQLYYNATMSWGAVLVLYVGENFQVAEWFGQFNLYIERWEKKGGSDATTHLNPDKAVFEYDADGSNNAAQATNVKFVLEASTESYYECVCRDEMLIGRQSEALDPSKVDEVSVSWLSSNTLSSSIDLAKYTASAQGETSRELMNLTQVSKSGNDWQFTITPQGKSPMGLKQQLYKEQVNGVDVYTEEYVDYVDWVVVSYTYDGKPFTHQMRVVRKAYHEEQLPTLTFSINPLTYTFSKAAEEKIFDIVATHQHGSVIYNVDKQAIITTYENGYEPTPVNLTSDNLTIELSDTWKNGSKDELTAELLDGGKIKVNTLENTSSSKRSAVLTGTLCPVKEQDANHPCKTFSIDLHQRYDNVGITLNHQPGKGNTSLQTNPLHSRQEQAVHTAERTIYYDNTEAIELRLPEAGYSGYMRWYDYQTNGAPNYNHCHDGKISTAWDYAPHAANGQAFAAINTPQSKESAESSEGYSLGLYALNKSARGNDGNTLTAAILDEDKNDNPAPRIRPWSDNGYHIMACDVSAYTDYEIVVQNRQIKSITEPTLSYRQLFHMRPASEMAKKMMDKSNAGEFLENYSYQAPAGKSVLLATEYRFHKYRSHISEMCYFYKDKDNTIKRITNETNVVWTEYTLQNDGTYGEGRIFTPIYTSSLDYLKVQEDRYPVQKKYTLTVPKANANTDSDLLIASFEVKFLDIERYGPTEKTIITQQRIESGYKLLANINFDNYDSRDQHLPWDYTSYGYVYDVDPLNTNAGFKRGASQGVFPFYGEYIVVDKVTKDWANSPAHSGKSLYVDGTMEPGLVATISAETNICSGQTVYCSAWFRNPRPNNNWAANGNTANPIFRCNIQGKNGEGEWEDAGVYFVGELAIGSQWQQVVFPIESAHTYDQTRVSIYNFATTNQGNDFMVDDINLYVSLLPITAYQGKMACRSVDAEHTNAAAVLRIDYSNIDAGDDGYMYYQIYNNSYENKNANGEVISKGAAVTLTGDAAYYHEAHTAGTHDHNDYGSVHIPAVNYDPEADNKKYGVDYFYSVSKMLDYMVENNLKHFKAYIKTENSGAVKWLLYVAHFVDNVTSNDIKNAGDQASVLPLQKLFDEHTYVMRMAYTPDELPVAACNLTTPLHATQQTVFRLSNSNQETIKHTITNDELTANGSYGFNVDEDAWKIHTHSKENKPNDLYFLTATVVNSMAEGIGEQVKNISAPIYADWLIGDPLGDVFSEKAPAETNSEAFKDYQNRLKEAEEAFTNKYGYTPGQVSHAIMYDMRREPTDEEPNPNYTATTFNQLEPSAFESQQNYEIIKHLYENEWLQLYSPVVHFYLSSKGDVARYWCFPIVGTAKAKVSVGGKEQEMTLKDCNEPHRVVVSSSESNLYCNIAPKNYVDLTPQQRTQIPTIKVLQSHLNNNVEIPITELGYGEHGMFFGETRYPTDKNIISVNLNKLPNYCSFINLETGNLIENPQLSVGTQHTLRLQMGQAKNNGNGNSKVSEEGYIFVNIQIVPDVLVWEPEGTSFNGWGKNENWKGWIDKNNDGKIDKVDDSATNELTEGFVPMEGADVVIPTLDNPLLYPYIVPDDAEHEHSHYPMTINFQPHHCKNIYFAPEAKIHNQHLLQYENAFVDMQVAAGSWNMVSAPMKGMVSGDMYIPHTGTWNGGSSLESTNPFVVSRFQGTRHTDAAYVFWQGFYNTTVDMRYEGNTNLKKVSSAEFVYSNALNQPLQVGSGYQLYGLGLAENEPLTIRLPKPDTEYFYYTPDGYKSEKSDPVTSENRNRLAYDGIMTITLTNSVETGSSFLFGNPTMAYIDMSAFLADNATVLNPVFHRVENNAWRSTTEMTLEHDRYLAPMTSVMLETKDKDNQPTITVTLKPEHLTLNNQIYTVEEQSEETENAPSRLIASSSEIMTIYTSTKYAHARTVLAANPAANDFYQIGEDALFVSTGVENKSAVTTPLNMYTVAEQVPMMADVRQGISSIPLAILAAEGYRTQYMQVAFYLSSNWTRTCYFCDSKTGQRIRIMDGLVISVEMPLNHEQRYYIEGPDTYNAGGNNDGTITSTTQPNISTSSHKVWAYAQDRSTIVVSATDVMKSVTLYDIAGRSLATLQPNLLSTQLILQTSGQSGVYIVAVTFRDNTTAQTQVLVP